MQRIDGVTFKMKRHYNFAFLSKYGRVFKVFDDQDSGNICFGTEKDGERLFIKFAGAPTEPYEGDPQDAVTRLKRTVPIYQRLRHGNLIEYVGSEEIGGGFAMVFKWTDAECMARMYPESRAKFLRMPLETRLKVFRDVMDFLEYAAEENYVAIDFYDGSIMYDFAGENTVICDIDFFREKPCINDMGRMWGSSLFQAPEEYMLGAQIDEVTNVYTLGATAFALLADFDRSAEGWPLSEALYQVVRKATSDDRNMRQQSIRQFIEEWEESL